MTRRPATLAIALIAAGSGCRQLFGIDDTAVASGNADAGPGLADATPTDALPDAMPPMPDAKLATCPGYMPISNASPPGATYRGVSANQSWMAARTTCQNDGADLVVVDNAAEATAVAALVQDPISGYIWLGLARDAFGEWVTVRGTLATYLPWAPGEPSGGNSCALMDDTLAPNQFYDFLCGSMQVSVCECLP
jgi:hypothetical protein